jgi:hypothetical protein
MALQQTVAVRGYESLAMIRNAPALPRPRSLLRFIIQLLTVLVIALGLESALGFYVWNSTPDPLSSQDIQHVEDYEKLINLAIPTAKNILERDGDIAQPIAFGIEMTGPVDFLNPQGNSTLDSLKRIIHEFKQGAHSGFYRSIAIAYDTNRQEGGPVFDALEFRFEHIDGESLRGWLRYKRRGPHQFWYGPVHLQRFANDVFSHQNIEYGETD